MNRKLSLRLLALVSILLLTVPVAAQDLWTTVRSDVLPRLEHSDSTTFRVTGADSDTSKWFNPWKWTSYAFVIHGHADSVAIQAQAWCGNKIGTNHVAVKCDSLSLIAPGDHVWQLDIPTSTSVQVIFSSATTATGTVTIDSARVNRNW